MTCQHAAEFIEAIAADEIQPTPELRAHFETCPSCASALAAAVRLEALLAANRSGFKANDVGPVWMGVLNDSYRTPGAGAILAEYKGGYILEMLRSLMWDSSSGDRDFRTMLQDYVKQYANHAVATEQFKSVLEKHMKRQMDLDGNGRLDWFFDDWVYGSDVPSYKLEYSLAPAKSGKTLLTGKLTQSGVSERFRMLVPVFAEMSGRKVRIGAMSIRGNSGSDFHVELPEQPKKILLNVNNDVLTEKEDVRQLK